MSHWIHNPSIYRTHDNALLFDLREDVWSADRVEWLTDSVVQMDTRLYPETASCQLTLDLDAGMGRATRSSAQGAKEFSGTMAEVRNWIMARNSVVGS